MNFNLDIHVEHPWSLILLNGINWYSEDLKLIQIFYTKTLVLHMPGGTIDSLS